jgi:phosphohistidine phosphatase
MLLLLLRHAEAEPAVSSDLERVLTPKGTEQAGLVGAYCRSHGLRPKLVLASPYRRTMQTAHIVAAGLQDVATLTDPFLASGMEPADALENLRSHRQFDCLMLVGHQPDLGWLAAALLGLGEGGTISFQLASLAGLRVERFAFGGASLDFFVPLALM